MVCSNGVGQAGGARRRPVPHGQKYATRARTANIVQSGRVLAKLNRWEVVTGTRGCAGRGGPRSLPHFLVRERHRYPETVTTAPHNSTAHLQVVKKTPRGDHKHVHSLHQTLSLGCEYRSRTTEYANARQGETTKSREHDGVPTTEVPLAPGRYKMTRVRSGTPCTCFAHTNHTAPHHSQKPTGASRPSAKRGLYACNAGCRVLSARVDSPLP